VSNDRLVNAAPADDEVQYEAGLRPRTLDEYIGQDRVREQLHVAITAAKQRGEALDHVLLYGPPDSARRRSPASSPTSSASASTRRRGR